jgi:fructose-1,6-bisphosphatase/sedoheptulose 1,7-bisphosphatase-like protein
MWEHDWDLNFVRVTEATALASARLMGRGDEAAAQKAAVTTMHELLHRSLLRCRIIVGEGEQGQVACLAHGDILGSGGQQPMDAAATKDSGVDVLMGVGGAPQGLLAAAALKGLGGDMQGRFLARTQTERAKVLRLGLADTNQILTIDDLVPGGEVLFVATGITDGDVLKGVRLSGKGATTHSLAIRCRTGTIRFIQTEHRFLPA